MCIYMYIYIHIQGLEVVWSYQAQLAALPNRREIDNKYHVTGSFIRNQMPFYIMKLDT